MAKHFFIISPLKYIYSITPYGIGTKIIPGVNYSLCEEVFPGVILHNFSIKLLVVASRGYIVM